MSERRIVLGRDGTVRLDRKVTRWSFAKWSNGWALMYDGMPEYSQIASLIDCRAYLLGLTDEELFG